MSDIIIPLFEDSSVEISPSLLLRSPSILPQSPLALRYLAQGFAFLYGYNLGESLRSFQRAADLDPDCAMAWWGLAASLAPHFNLPFCPTEDNQAALAALDRARKVVFEKADVQKSLIEAQSVRFALDGGDRAQLDAAYSAAMKRAWERFPLDPEVQFFLKMDHLLFLNDTLRAVFL